MSILAGVKNSIISRLFKGIKYWYVTYVSNLNRSKFGYIDDTVHLAPPLTFTKKENIYLYGNNSLRDAKIFSTNARFIMRPYAGAAEGLRVSTGNHAMIVGRFYRTIKESEKPAGLDKDVIIEEDAWIGRNVTLLPGVIVGRGAIVGAGAVLRSSIPPYSIAIGNPARVIGFKFSPQEVLEHERLLYPEEERLSENVLNENYNKYFMNRLKDIKSYLKV